ncbi:LysR family transcriptional regulator [Leminorella grimontii]|uniref:LysR family transcriptional regulator n=1 Tax=Leminorella grimontii TaxID=82981 RepID=A0AAV5N158_9GAMM|nr:LysR substrate-binding domain-containing protein [Leminorella grimontii]KFC93454.1 transcriptional regulator [Leminorella grimontii ATCC 33999 = DSM 5078]GKX55851.1 LysR family transcriptional regulator [Leminorella grimontii]VFS55033.1 HTH-type transcriptional regulator gltC [Leminorella grimontii]
MTEKSPLALDLDALRSLVFGIDSGSFALAAQRLYRSTSAVSAQLKKLEQQCGTPLLEKRGRGLGLTPSGEVLLSYARRLLALNDEALRTITGERLQGEVHLGMQEDFGESLMPEVLGRFNRQHPGLRITARVDRNQPLVDGVRRGELDLALAWHHQALPNPPIAQLPLRWIALPSLILDQSEPLPLVLFEAPCLMRNAALEALNHAGIPWRVAFTSHSLSGIWAAVSAGLGITVRTRIGLPTTLTTLNDPDLPELPQMGIALLESSSSPSDAVAHLRHLLHTVIKDAL